ncbi:uncharacterized protein [Macrobrachium rosenbergii]|uniref:uncharacterized protein n=1 Tax=Macrobrachium rosenbergii TaxID=79674 RepID=UPI0034D64DC6
MKAVLALCFLGVASAAVIPLTYNAGVIPYTGVVPQAAGFLPINTGIIPQAGIIPGITTYQVSAVAPAPGYVAKTLGSEHVAPLPAGSANFASHHINVAKAPGTE